MRITTNYSISNKNYQNNKMQKCNKPCFQANLTKDVQEVLIFEAKKIGLLAKLNEQIKSLADWGSQKSFISTCFNPHNGKTSLALENYHVSRNYAGDLKVNENENLLNQFFSLSAEKVLGAEKNLADAAHENKIKAIDEILKNPKYIKEISGETNPSDEKLAASIEKLTEDDLIDYRFHLKDKIVDSLPVLDFEVLS